MRSPTVLLRHVLLLSVALLPGLALAQQEGKLYSVTSNVFRPEKQPFNEDRLKQLKVPEGFEVSVFGQNLDNVRMMAVADNGMVYVTRPMEKDVIAIATESAERSMPRTVPSGRTSRVLQLIAAFGWPSGPERLIKVRRSSAIIMRRLASGSAPTSV